jgi:hypothetical protein
MCLGLGLDCVESVGLGLYEGELIEVEIAGVTVGEGVTSGFGLGFAFTFDFGDGLFGTVEAGSDSLLSGSKISSLDNPMLSKILLIAGSLFKTKKQKI